MGNMGSAHPLVKVNVSFKCEGNPVISKGVIERTRIGDGRTHADCPKFGLRNLVPNMAIFKLLPPKIKGLGQLSRGLLSLTFSKSRLASSWLAQHSGTSNTQHYGLGMTENCGYLVAACKQKKRE